MSPAFTSIDLLTSVLGGGITEVIFRAIALGIAVMGAYFLLCAFMPASWYVKKTKDTVGFNLTMFYLHSAVATFFFIGAVLLIVAGLVGFEGKKIDVPMTGFVFAILNGSCMVGNYYIVFMKRKNMQAARRLGITEYEYHRDYIAKVSVPSSEETALNVVE